MTVLLWSLSALAWYTIGATVIAFYTSYRQWQVGDATFVIIFGGLGGPLAVLVIASWFFGERMRRSLEDDK